VTATAILTAELTDSQFCHISQLVGGISGINLHEGKKELVKARLSKQLRRLGITSYDDYIDFVHGDASGKELTSMVDALCTNLTRFFREKDHFTFLADKFLAPMAENSDTQNKKLRIWSAGCSSGQEAYSIGITISETLKDLENWDAAILATDLSTQTLSTAHVGKYDQKRIEGIPPYLRAKYFDVVETRPVRRYRVSDDIRRLVHFAQLNLMSAWPMRGLFDAIFCRNVMIYFNKSTQQKLIERFWKILRPGGKLFIGHSESLAGISHRFKYVQPTIYEKGV